MSGLEILGAVGLGFLAVVAPRTVLVVLVLLVFLSWSLWSVVPLAILGLALDISAGKETVD